MSAEAPHVRYQPADGEGIGRLTLSRPSKLNATDDTTLRHLAEAVDAASADAAVRALVVAGEGRALCAGIDLAALARDAIPDDWFRRWDETLLRLERMPAATVAAIRGPCLGGGLQLALCCDLRIAAEDALATRRLLLGCFDLPVERFLDACVAAQQRCREDPETRAKLASHRARFRR
jgi:enoyl-CoA hydratase/carnithine racemase